MIYGLANKTLFMITTRKSAVYLSTCLASWGDRDAFFFTMAPFLPLIIVLERVTYAAGRIAG